MRQPSAQLRGLCLGSVSKQFRLPDGSEFAALYNVSLSLPDNHIGVLLGPSGCGKSTLLRMVAGLETVD